MLDPRQYSISVRVKHHPQIAFNILMSLLISDWILNTQAMIKGGRNIVAADGTKQLGLVPDISP